MNLLWAYIVSNSAHAHVVFIKKNLHKNYNILQNTANNAQENKVDLVKVL